MKKKIVLNRTRRNFLILFLTCGLIILSYGIYYTYNLPLQDQRVPTYSYNNRARIDYSVIYKPNLLNEETGPAWGDIYITNYVDHINTVFDYTFSGERQADIRGDYSITAVVEAQERASEENEAKIIWRKDFVLLPRTSFSASDVNFSLREELPVHLAPFQDYVEQVMEESRVGGNHWLTVKWDIHLTAETDGGTIRENLTPTLVMPLRDSYFTIGGEQEVDKPGAIEKVIQIEAPYKKTMLLAISILDGLCLLLLLFLLACTAGAQPSYLEREMKRVLKKHGERLVELATARDLAFEGHDLWPVKTIEDLVRIADELGKPILYQYELATGKEVPVFFVSDEKRVFIYRLLPAEPVKQPSGQALSYS